MNSCERAIKALNHREPDRVPFDLERTVTDRIPLRACLFLHKDSGLPDADPKIINGFQPLVQIKKDVMPASFDHPWQAQSLLRMLNASPG